MKKQLSILGSGRGSINHNNEIAGKEKQKEPKERSHRTRKKENTIKSKPRTGRGKQANKRTVMEDEDRTNDNAGTTLLPNLRYSYTLM